MSERERKKKKTIEKEKDKKRARKGQKILCQGIKTLFAKPISEFSLSLGFERNSDESLVHNIAVEAHIQW